MDLAVYGVKSCLNSSFHTNPDAAIASSISFFMRPIRSSSLPRGGGGTRPSSPSSHPFQWQLRPRPRTSGTVQAFAPGHPVGGPSRHREGPRSAHTPCRSPPVRRARCRRCRRQRQTHPGHHPPPPPPRGSQTGPASTSPNGSSMGEYDYDLFTISAGSSGVRASRFASTLYDARSTISANDLGGVKGTHTSCG